MSEMIPIIIPAYEPDERLIALMRSIVNEREMIVIVDDGSGPEYAGIFEECKAIMGNRGIVLTHEENMGKGRALKTAFSYILRMYPNVLGVVTADSDGQHNKQAIESVKEGVRKHPKSLILGVRSFDGEGIPWKSSFGNKLTINILSYMSGVRVSDTQTGLRGIPAVFLEELLYVKGERFEFEMQMLIESFGSYPIVEIPIETIYDSEENHQTHFHPVIDSIKIYRIFGKMFLKYIFSSFSSCILDLLLFIIFCNVLKQDEGIFYVAIATVLSRIISAVYNYLVNYKLVFNSKEEVGISAARYFLLAVIQMAFSALFVTLGVALARGRMPKAVIKIVVDTVLFFASYYIQRRYVFSKRV